ncbi:hypothetical protein [Actinomycetospora sp. NBC_00405]|uniref:hypothetical protein n=1 Tax=Actinomycetospora sp. NBC_00405 TaxID=2975952 RepID=UPI002E21B2B7
MFFLVAAAAMWPMVVNTAGGVRALDPGLNARDQLAYDQVIAVILVIGVLGYLLDALARRALDARPRSARLREREPRDAAPVGSVG